MICLLLSDSCYIHIIMCNHSDYGMELREHYGNVTAKVRFPVTAIVTDPKLLRGPNSRNEHRNVSRNFAV